MNLNIKKSMTRGLATVGVLGITLSSVGGVALAESGTQMYQANLTELNHSGDTGTTTTMMVDGTHVKLRTTGSSPNLAHAQHIHIGGTGTCPLPSADKDGDGIINTTEGTPAYGPIEVSLTTSGDLSKDSGLAVDRFPVADADGNFTYERTFDLPEGVTAEMVGNGVIVTHGVSEMTGDKTKYDGDKKSDIPGSEALPLEATAPAACGKLVSMPTGGSDTGGGSTASDTSALATVGALGLLSAGALAAFGTRRTNLNK